MEGRPSSALLSSYDSSKPLKIVQWNIERNYKATEIINELKALNADVLVFQEIDINCERSGNLNHMDELATALQMKGGFVCEFEEIKSPLRSERDQGGGYHGNAIFSKYELFFGLVKHDYPAFDWDNNGEKLKEPRRGQRYTLTATMPTTTGSPPLLIYSVHLEVFTGISGRLKEFSSVLLHAHTKVKSNPHQIIFGDLNTMGHSIARLSPKFARDQYRFMSLGQSEAEWWDKKVIAPSSTTDPLATSGLATFLGEEYSGFPPEVRSRLALQRSDLFFYDPFDPKTTVTLHERNAHFGLFKGKLDWTLIRCCKTLKTSIGNLDFTASDHRWLCLEIEYDAASDTKPDRAKQLWLDRNRTLRSNWAMQRPSGWAWKSTAVAIIAASAYYGYYMSRRR